MYKNILSWNVAGLRARLKYDDKLNNSIIEALLNQINEEQNICEEYDIVCLQETKCTKEQVDDYLDDRIKYKYPYRYWNSSNGETQRKGLSGTSIWCTSQPIRELETPDFDNEGRILSLEFKDFILINVYVPNSQKLDSERYNFRINWNKQFMNYLINLRKLNNIIICGDLNVAHTDLDICNPRQKKNKVAGFYDIERLDFGYMLDELNLIDIFRKNNPNIQKSTYWSNFLKSKRMGNNGWRIDYFLLSEELLQKYICNIEIKKYILGSDHCPIVLNINI
tara:strand:- start:3262 stop:4101 length:840 start_codon:yes stop_codon:yes gene_type:complete